MASKESKHTYLRREQQVVSRYDSTNKSRNPVDKKWEHSHFASLDSRLPKLEMKGIMLRLYQHLEEKPNGASVEDALLFFKRICHPSENDDVLRILKKQEQIFGVADGRVRTMKHHKKFTYGT